MELIQITDKAHISPFNIQRLLKFQTKAILSFHLDYMFSSLKQNMQINISFPKWKRF